MGKRALARSAVSVTRAEGARIWPVRANALLLLLQAIGLAGIAAYGIWAVDWQAYTQLGEGTVLIELEEEAEHAVVTALVFGPSVVLALLATVGFLFMVKAGWLLAMISQGLSLLGCLLIFSSWAPDFVYPVMLYCILLVVYLNSSAVRAAFDVRRSTRKASHAA